MSDLVRTILTMSLSGSILAILLFLIKPFICNRLPKTAQYYLWLVVIIALLVPVSQITALQRNTDTPAQVIPAIPVIAAIPTINETVTRFVVTQEEEQVRLQNIPHVATATVPARSPIAFITTYFVLVYPFGVLVFALYYLINYMLFAQLYRRRNQRAGAKARAMLAEMSNGRPPQLYFNQLATTPMLLGVFRPVIILPDQEYSLAQLDAIFAHELTHLRRKDTFVKWLTLIASALHWFNPIMWLVSREIDRACELSCDEAVIRNMDIDGKRNYGHTLIAVSASSKAPRAVTSATMCEEKKNLRERLGAIMKSKKNTRTVFVLSVLLIVLAACGAVALGVGSNNNSNNAAVYQGEPWIYENFYVGIGLVLPAEFRGNVTIVEDNDRPAFTVVHTATNKILTERYGNGEGFDLGWLFTIFREPVNSERFGFLVYNANILFQDSEYAIMFMTPSPSDVQYDWQNMDSPETIEYLKLSSGTMIISIISNAFSIGSPPLEFPTGSVPYVTVAANFYIAVKSDGFLANFDNYQQFDFLSAFAEYWALENDHHFFAIEGDWGIVFWADGVLRDIQAIFIDYDELMDVPIVSGAFHISDELLPGVPLVLSRFVTVGGVMPREGISFVDASGARRYFAIADDRTGYAPSPYFFIEFINGVGWPGRTTDSIPAYITIRDQQFSTALTSLELTRWDLTNEEIQPLRYMVNLTELIIANSPMYARYMSLTDISPLAGLTNLVTLHLHGNQINDITPLAGLTNLRGLNLMGNDITGIAPLANLTNLTWLSIGFNPIVDISPIAGLTNINDLCLSFTGVSDISILANFTNLTDLGLDGNQVSDLTPLAGLTNLRYLYLYGNQISDLTPLAGLTNLVDINLGENYISDITPLSGLPSTAIIFLDWNPITDWSPLEHLEFVIGRP